MKKPVAPGTINGFVAMKASLYGVPFGFDGTVRGLTIAARAAGAKVGDRIESEFGPQRMTRVIGDDRAGGYWCERITFKLSAASVRITRRVEREHAAAVAYYGLAR